GGDFPPKITIYTDSEYVKNGITAWIFDWKANGWRTASKKPVKNQDLWQQLDALAAELPLHWQWVRGHSGNALNERCDALTQKAIENL
ncbi:MAG: ribonuclease HI, partial [Spirochaetaceae bacterium]|nr:ribonuclease HI [Spirochaetaceae bacterium]